MGQNVCALAADTKVETPEGPMTVRAVAGKAIAVFTRAPEGQIRFRMMQNVRKTAEQQAVLRVTLENGRAFRVAPEQVLFAKGMIACRADALRPGVDLEAAFVFPEGYQFVDDRSAETRESSACLRVAGIEPGGAADLYAVGVNKADCFLLAAGVLCKADD